MEIKDSPKSPSVTLLNSDVKQHFPNLSLLTFFIIYTGAFSVMAVNPMPIME